MPIFLIVFLTLYGLMNSYVFWKIHLAFPDMGRLHYAVAGALGLMVASPIVARLVDRAGRPRLGGVLNVVAFSWLPITFWLFCFGLAGDAWNIGVTVIAGGADAAGGLVVGPRALLLGIGAIAAGLVALSVIEAHAIRLRAFTVRSDKLAPLSKPIRIVQISDVHLGGGMSRRRFVKALRIIEEAHADLIVSTGDLLDSPADNLTKFSASLAQVTAPLGKYAIMGNHEYYAGLREAERFYQAAGFTLLRRQSVPVGEDLWIAGADDPASQYGMPRPLDPLPVPAPEGRRPFVLLLKHRPTVQPDSPGRFDLQLSGHTHGGQIFPFTLVVAITERYDRGWFKLDKGSQLFVSMGTGSWGPPMRFLARPEVTLVTIEPA
jgi:predicted MPP superfamily phosphohydrolase